MQRSAFQALHDLDAWMAFAIILKTLTYSATFAAAGGLFFWIPFRAHLAVREADELRRFIGRIAWAGLFLSVLRVASINGMLTGDLAGMVDPAMTQTVMASPEGPATVLRIAGLLLIIRVCRRERQDFPLPLLMCAAVAAVSAFALVGHAGDIRLALGGGLLPQAVLCLHLVAVAFWLGSLSPLFRLTREADRARSALLLERFGNQAVWGVGLLVASGMLLLWLLIDRPAAMWSSAYGQLFLLKLTLVFAMLVLAARNKWQLTPGFRLSARERDAAIMLRRAIMAEMALALAILLVTAGITTLVGPG